MNNERFKKVSSLLPKNKTGIFASEIQSMIVPNNKIYHELSPKIDEPQTASTKQINTVSLSQPNDSSITAGYQKHSAFKVKVKPRQALASVNIKLAEQRYSAKRGTPRTQSTKFTEHQNNDDFDYERLLIAQTPSTIKQQDELNNDLYISNKDAFRPSAVKRREFIKYEHPKSSTIERARPLIAKSPSVMSHFKDTELKLAFQKAELNYKTNKQDESNNNSHKKEEKTYDLIEHLRDASEALTLKSENYTDLNSIIRPVNNNNNKSTSDIFNEIYSEIHLIKNPTRAILRQRSFLNDASTESKPKFDDKDFVLNQLGEEEFLKFLKEYRKTKNLNLASISLVGGGGGGSSSNDSKKSIEDMSSVQMFKAPTQNIISVNDTFGLLSNNSPNITTYYQFKNSLPNQSKQSFFINYLSNKILKNSRSVVEILFDEEKGSAICESNKSKSAKEFKNLNECRKISKNDTKLQQLKILNFPAIAN